MDPAKRNLLKVKVERKAAGGISTKRMRDLGETRPELIDENALDVCNLDVWPAPPRLVV